jgi:hypothetical protein
VVTHQAKQVQTDSIGFSALGQPEQKPLAVTIISENRLPAIPSDRHMIDRTRKFYSEMSRHSCNLHSKCLACKFYMSSFGLTPAVLKGDKRADARATKSARRAPGTKDRVMRCAGVVAAAIGKYTTPAIGKCTTPRRVKT